MSTQSQSQNCVFCHATKSKSYHVANMDNTRFCPSCASTLGLTRDGILSHLAELWRFKKAF